jgi:hypothetical protein
MIKFRKLENLHIVFWLFKDAGWACNFKILAICMIFPTVIMALIILNRQWKNISDRFHNIAVVLWITANSIWMIGEFFGWDEKPPYLRKVALIPFTIGIVIIGYYYIFLAKKQNAIEDDMQQS